MAVAGVRTAVPYCASASARAVSRQIEVCAVPAGLRACLGAWRGQAVRQQRRPAAASGFRRGLHLLRALQRPDYAVREEGQPETLDYRVFFSDKSGKTISPWHDIPLHAGNGLFNFVVEIPKETKAKMEVATDETHNPIKQDTKKGKLRYYPYNINWNYGLLPQTWEDPEHSNKEVEGAFGDNDPVDVVEIGERQAKIGDVVKVKPLAVLAMIDEGELDWKVVAISVDDPKASLVNDVESVEKHFPGTLTAIRDWFRDYKIPDGKPANKFGLGNKPADKDYALSVIAETNQAWAKLAKKSAAAAVTPESIQADTTEPLLLRAVRGEIVERPPVWLMRQAGRYMKVYQQLCEKYPTFRERSENVDVAVEVSLQPWRAFKPDGVILFSDILTPLTGMNIPFDILKSKGPVIHKPIRTAADVAEVRELVPEEAVPYVGEALAALRSEVGNASTVLGFVGAPFTLASYIVEGGSSKHFTVIKRLAFETPEILHSLLQKLAESVIIYTRYQADKGAQAVQIFDSWATHLSPKDFEVFSLPYIKQIVREVKATHPHLPLILYASGSGGLLERMATADVDVISLDWTVDIAEARQRVGTDRAVQGNIDPGVLFGTKDFISQRIHETVAQAGSRKHILNLGHGVLLGTPEESVAHFFEVAKGLRY